MRSDELSRRGFDQEDVRDGRERERTGSWSWVDRARVVTMIPAPRGLSETTVGGRRRERSEGQEGEGEEKGQGTDRIGQGKWAQNGLGRVESSVVVSFWRCW